MPRRDPDPALRRLVADLSRLRPDDAEAILGALDPEERVRLDRVIAGVPEPVAQEEAPAWRYEGVSPWLIERIEPDSADNGGRRRGFVLMMPAAVDALRAAAEPFRARPADGRRGPPLLSRALGWLSGVRA